jgi:hypothetical protein
MRPNHGLWKDGQGVPLGAKAGVGIGVVVFRQPPPAQAGVGVRGGTPS